MKLKNLFLMAGLTFTLCLFCGITANAATEGIYTYKISYSEATITDCDTSASGSITIPSTLGGYPVTSIGSHAFYYCDITSITIPDSVTSIGYRAFSGCYRLTSITIPDSVTTIGDWAFYDCESLASITIPDSVTSIGEHAFFYCYSLASVTIPDSVTTIGYGAFAACYSLASVTIGNSVTSIGDSAFSGCSSLESITIPDSVTTIGDSAFYGCSSLSSITIPDGVTTIGDKAFYDCESLSSITVDGNNQYYTSENGILFNKDKNTLIAYPPNKTDSSYIVPDSVTTIGDLAFYNCDSLSSINIPDGVTSISYGAFSDCDSLSSITIPDSVTTISYGAFSDCDSLSSITIPDNVTSIGDNAFNDCDSLASITIPDSVTSIGNGAFYRCSSLASVTIGNSVTSIGDSAFSGCSSLESITIPDSVTTIGDSAFYRCSSLASVTIGNSMTSIGSRAFRYCVSLASITIPDSVTTIGDWAFYECSSLATVYYTGTAEQWKKIDIGRSNEYLLNANIVIGSGVHSHSFGDWKASTSEVHKRECDCGYTESAPHTWNDGVMNGSVKTLTCTGCGRTQKVEAEDNTDSEQSTYTYRIVDDHIYYYDEDGNKLGYVTGTKFVEVNGDTYYIENNIIIYNYYVINNHIYYFGDDGVMQNDGKNTFHKDGYIKGDGYITLGGNTYYIENNVVIVNNNTYYGVYSDVQSSDWFYDAVTYAYENNITSGVSENRFAPEGKVTRGQFITMLCRAYGVEEMTGDNFADCGNTWYTGYLAAAKQLGISNGIGNNKFAPEKEITREEMVTLVYNHLKLIGEADEAVSETDFSDNNMISDWAKVAVSFTWNKGIVKGINNNTFNPKGTATRAELVQIFYNIFDE